MLYTYISLSFLLFIEVTSIKHGKVLLYDFYPAGASGRMVIGCYLLLDMFFFF